MHKRRHVTAITKASPNKALKRKRVSTHQHCKKNPVTKAELLSVIKPSEKSNVITITYRPIQQYSKHEEGNLMVTLSEFSLHDFVRPGQHIRLLHTKNNKIYLKHTNLFRKLYFHYHIEDRITKLRENLRFLVKLLDVEHTHDLLADFLPEQKPFFNLLTNKYPMNVGVNLLNDKGWLTRLIKKFERITSSKLDDTQKQRMVVDGLPDGLKMDYTQLLDVLNNLENNKFSNVLNNLKNNDKFVEHMLEENIFPISNFVKLLIDDPYQITYPTDLAKCVLQPPFYNLLPIEPAKFKQSIVDKARTDLKRNKKVLHVSDKKRVEYIKKLMKEMGLTGSTWVKIKDMKEYHIQQRKAHTPWPFILKEETISFKYINGMEKHISSKILNMVGQEEEEDIQAAYTRYFDVLLELQQVKNENEQIIKTKSVYKDIIVERDNTLIPKNSLSSNQINSLAKNLFKYDEMKLRYDKHQIDAMKYACINKISCITGGPGRGKTTILNGIVDALQAIERRDPSSCICICAPTGKAVQRINSASGKNIVAKTLHSFYGYALFQKKKNIHKKYTLVLDEASMAPFSILFLILRDLNICKFILIGDVDQLPPIQPGQVFKDMVEKLKPSITKKLEKNYRQADIKSIPDNCDRMMAGQLPIDSVCWNTCFFGKLNEDVYNNIVREAVAQIRQLICYRIDLKNELNKKMQKAIHKLKTLPENKPFLKNDLVVYIGQNNKKNNGIMKGTLGFVHSEVKDSEKKGGKTGRIFKIEFVENDQIVKERIKNLFTNNKQQTTESQKSLEINVGWRDIELAYCITGHKAQGSEYDDGGVLLDYKDCTFCASRQWVYTGSSRFKKSVKFYCPSGFLLQKVVNRKKIRKTRLFETHTT